MTPPAGPPAVDPRRHDLDALRAFAMLLGIGLHASLSFFPAPWPVQDTQQSPLFGLLMFGLHGFRMPLFFLLSGYFTMLLYRRRGLSALLRQRALRILLPCLIGLVTIIPVSRLTMFWAMSRGMTTAAIPEEEPLIAAIRASDLDRIRELVPDQDTANQPVGPFRIRPFSWAVLVANLETIQLLHERGADVNQSNDDGNTPLHSAAFLGRSDVVAWLIEQGANPNAMNLEGNLPLAAVDTPLPITQWIVQFLRLPPIDEQQLAAGRAAVRQQLEPLTKPKAEAASAGTPRVAPASGNWLTTYRQWLRSPAFRIGSGPFSIQLFETAVWDHLWFLWFLCWLVLLFAVGVRFWPPAAVTVAPSDTEAAEAIPHIDTTLALPVANPLESEPPAEAPRPGPLWSRLWWLVVLTLLPQAAMGVDLPTIGPDSCMALLPWPHVLLYYGLFFWFGVRYYDADDVAGRLGRRWWLWLPLALLVVLPAALATLGQRAINTPVQVGYTWLMIIGLIGLFRRFGQESRPLVRYLSDSAYWLYLIHMPVVVVGQLVVREWPWNPWLKFGLVTTVTTLLLLVSYHWCVRWTWIGRLLNGPRPRPVSHQPVS